MLNISAGRLAWVGLDFREFILRVMSRIGPNITTPPEKVTSPRAEIAKCFRKLLAFNSFYRQENYRPPYLKPQT
jgi:hypothetical protein